MDDSEFRVSFLEALAREVYASFGFATFLAQCFERSLLELNVIILALEGNQPKGSFHGLVDKLSERTMGQLLKRLKSKIKFIPADEKIIMSAYNKRNDLAHSYFWKSSKQAPTTKIQRKLIEDFKDAQHLFDLAEKTVEKYILFYYSQVDQRIKNDPTFDRSAYKK